MIKNQFRDKKVLIFGLGLNEGGEGAAEFFAKHGANVTVTDLKTKAELEKPLAKLKKYKNITYRLGLHLEDDFRTHDLILRNPAVKPDNRFLQIAKAEHKQIETEMTLFFKLCPCKIIGITGTRGKSTTTTLIYEFLKANVKSRVQKVFLGGNIGKSALRFLDTLEKGGIVVLELSSFQLSAMAGFGQSPQVAILTNIYREHLNWHNSMDDYINAKKTIFAYQDKSGISIVNLDNEVTKKFMGASLGKSLSFSLVTPNANYYLNNDSLVYEDKKPLVNISKTRLEGDHNKYNILAAICAARQFNVSTENILRVLKRFKGIHGRQEFIREINGVRYYNDTTATSIEAVQAMLNRFGPIYKNGIVIIFGGVDKGLDYSLLKGSLNSYLKNIVFLEGSASEKLVEALNLPPQTFYSNLADAVAQAVKLARPGDIVVLCPGAASFNMFKNEFDRGDQFVSIVTKLAYA